MVGADGGIDLTRSRAPAHVVNAMGSVILDGPRVRFRSRSAASATLMARSGKGLVAWFFAFFIVSGFCSLVYQVVWLRVAMAQFGVTTPLISIVLSVFMGGLALGSWGAGRVARRFEGRPARVFLGMYAITELVIGLSGLVVAPALAQGRLLFAAPGSDAAWASSGYYLASGAWITLTLFPFCTCMGATFPLAMAGVRAAYREESARSFSYLYIANVLGAAAGTLGSAFVLVELVGFHRTLQLAALLNALLAATAWAVGRRVNGAPAAPRAAAASDAMHIGGRPVAGAFVLSLLCTTGLTSLAMEVVWTRQFVPFQGSVVYAFATILTVYLGATVAGSRIYRAWASRRRLASGGDPASTASILAGFCGLLPLLAADPRLPLGFQQLFGVARVAVGIGPFCGVLGFLMPMLIDRWSSGDPGRAGKAYAINTLGCIVGPLLSGFVLMPLVGERSTLVLLSLPFFVFGLLAARPRVSGAASTGGSRRVLVAAWTSAAAIAAVLLAVLTRDFESFYPGRVVRRDHTATVIAAGEGMRKIMLVNGMGITSLTPITKVMAHLPLAFHETRPENGLVLCFGMGTSFRSMLSWGIPTTAVELVPSVPSLFGYYYPDADELLRSPLARIVIDDARRFLERSPETFDVITVDPPPPVEAAGSSLLYSKEFYEVAKKRLKPGGIFAQWLPYGEAAVVAGVARSLTESFPYVRAFPSVEGWGIHFLASTRPIPRRSATELAARFPAAAGRDLLEWGPASSVQEQLVPVVTREYFVKSLLDVDPRAAALTDDRPVNEYFFLRRTFFGSRPLEIKPSSNRR